MNTVSRKMPAMIFAVCSGSFSTNKAEFRLVRFILDSGPLLKRYVRWIMSAAVVHDSLP
jgi:hypothetical protein